MSSIRVFWTVYLGCRNDTPESGSNIIVVASPFRVLEVVINIAYFLCRELHTLSRKQFVPTAVQYKKCAVGSCKAGNVGVVKAGVDHKGIKNVCVAFLG